VWVPKTRRRTAAAPGIGVLLVGNSILEGVGTALLIPPVYILTTMYFDNVTARARAFGIITGMGGIGAAAGAHDRDHAAIAN
jgi:MFS family permease